jgi:anthranilate synthase component 1
VPDILLLVSEEIAIVDNLSGKLTLVVYAAAGQARRVPGGARALEGSWLAALRDPVAIPGDICRRVQSRQSSGFGEAAYHAKVERAKRYVY